MGYKGRKYLYFIPSWKQASIEVCSMTIVVSVLCTFLHVDDDFDLLNLRGFSSRNNDCEGVS